MKRTLIRSITLGFFIVLIIGFVGYQSGLLSKPLQTSPNGGSLNSSNAGSTSDDTLPVMMPSSKVLIIKDEIKISEEMTPISEEKKEMMYGSKSAIMFEPKDFNDSIEITPDEWEKFTDTLKLKY